jgi:hypothetical protein
VIPTLVALAGRARADEPAPTEPACPPALTPTAPPAAIPAAKVIAASDLVAEERAFERDYERFIRRRELTERLVREREARAFDEAQVRFLRFSELTRKLADESARTLEREFDDAVALYVVKRNLTLELAEARTATPAVVPSNTNEAGSR